MSRENLPRPDPLSLVETSPLSSSSSRLSKPLDRRMPAPFVAVGLRIPSMLFATAQIRYWLFDKPVLMRPSSLRARLLQRIGLTLLRLLYFRINVDGAYLPSARIGAIGVPAPDSSGAVLGGFARPVPISGPASSVEASALCAGLEFATTCGWTSAIVESDATTSVNKIRCPSPDLSLLGGLLTLARSPVVDSHGHLQVCFASQYACSVISGEVSPPSPWLSARLTPADVAAIMEVPISSERADTLIWGDHDSGIYTVRSGYLYLQCPTSPLIPPSHLWKILAKLPAVLKVSSFGWRCGQDALPVGSCLRDAGLSTSACTFVAVGLRIPSMLFATAQILYWLFDKPISADGAYHPSARIGAIGVLARDSSGAVLGGFARPVPVSGPASSVEASALCTGLDFANACGWTLAIV
ncbi:hypothetical protein GQ457_01G020630 [Hibiscus cannabinus]